MNLLWTSDCKGKLYIYINTRFGNHLSPLNKEQIIIEILKKAVSARMCTDSRSILWKSKKINSNVMDGLCAWHGRS